MNVAKTKDRVAELAKIVPSEDIAKLSDQNITDTIDTKEARKAVIFAQARELGVTGGKGSLSLFATAMLFQKAIVDGDLKADHAADLYDAYASGKATVALENLDSRKAQISTLLTYGKAGAVACYAVDVDADGKELGVSLYRRATFIHGKMNAEERHSLMMSYPAVNRAINNKLDELKGDTAALLAIVNDPETGDAFLEAAMSKKASSERDAIGKLEAVVKSMRTLGKNEFSGDGEYHKMLKFAEWLYAQRKQEATARPQMD